MEFLPTVNLTPWSGPVFAVIVGVLLLAVIVISVLQLIFKKDVIDLLEPVLMYGTCTVLVCTMIWAGVSAVKSLDGKDNLQANLQQKYEISSVEFDNKDASVSFTENESQIILVNLENGKQASFMLTQDSTTNEPTLSEVPGKSDITVEDITR